MAPGLVKPMVYDVNTLAKVNEVFGTLFAALLGRRDIDTARLVTRHYSRVYADMTVLSELLSEAGLPANLFEMMLRDERRDRVPMRPSLRLLGITLRMVRLVVQTGRLTDGQARPLREGRSRLEPFRTRDWTAVPLSGLLIELDTLTALRNSLFWFFFCCVFNSAARARVLRTWVARKAPGVEFGDLLRGVAGIKSLEPSLDLIRLAEQANYLDEETRAALLAADDGTLRALSAPQSRGASSWRA